MLNETLRGVRQSSGGTTFVTVALCIVALPESRGGSCWGSFALGDRYKVGHVQGIWMALAQYAHEGTLYPPLSDGVRFGGTRYMPLPIVLNAAASRATGEYLMSGKAVAMLLFVALLILVFVVLRQLCCPGVPAFALAGLLSATNTGVLVGCSVGGDVLPVVFQICSLVTASPCGGKRLDG